MRAVCDAWLDDPIPRDVVIPAYDAAMAALAGALHEATTPKALGCVVRPTTQWHKGIEERHPSD